MRGRDRGLGSLLAIIVLFAAGACSSSAVDPNRSADGGSDPTGPSSSASTTSSSAPSDTDTASTTTPPAIAPADRTQLRDLPGSLAIRTSDGHLLVFSPDGSRNQEIALADRRRLTQPTWSTAGDQLAWSSAGVDGFTLEVTSVEVIDDALEAEDRAVTSISLDSPPFYLSWSPGDTYIAALRPSPGTIEFAFANVAAGSVRPVSTGQPFYFDWRDNQSVVAAVNGQTLLDLDASGQTAPRTTPTSSPLGVFQAPARVADGMVVALDEAGANAVVVLDADGVGRTVAEADAPISIAVDPQGDTIAILVVDATPESQVIAFQPDQPPTLPQGRVSLLDLETGEVTTRPESEIAAMQWSPDGSRLALLRAQPSGLQWLIVDDSTVTPLTTFLPSPEFANSYLPFADQYNHSTSWWSPDSRAVVFSGLVGADSGVWVDLIDDENSAVRVADGDIGVWSPR